MRMRQTRGAMSQVQCDTPIRLCPLSYLLRQDLREWVVRAGLANKYGSAEHTNHVGPPEEAIFIVLTGDHPARQSPQSRTRNKMYPCPTAPCPCHLETNVSSCIQIALSLVSRTISQPPLKPQASLVETYWLGFRRIPPSPPHHPPRPIRHSRCRGSSRRYKVKGPLCVQGSRRPVGPVVAGSINFATGGHL